MALIKCPECGHKISEIATICPNCGYPIQNCQNSLKENNDDSKPHETNSIITIIKCPDCGKIISDESNECPKCGCPPHLFEHIKQQSLQRSTHKKSSSAKYIILLGLLVLGIAFYFLNDEVDKQEPISSPPTFTQEVFKSDLGYAIFKSNNTEVVSVMGTLTIGNFFMVMSPESPDSQSFGEAIFLISDDLSGRKIYACKYSYHIEDTDNSITFYNGEYNGDNISVFDVRHIKYNTTVAKLCDNLEDSPLSFSVSGLRNQTNENHVFSYYDVDNRTDSYKSSIRSFIDHIK